MHVCVCVLCLCLLLCHHRMGHLLTSKIMTTQNGAFAQLYGKSQNEPQQGKEKQPRGLLICEEDCVLSYGSWSGRRWSAVSFLLGCSPTHSPPLSQARLESSVRPQWEFCCGQQQPCQYCCYGYFQQCGIWAISDFSQPLLSPFSSPTQKVMSQRQRSTAAFPLCAGPFSFCVGTLV